jgi:hypothetical protein
MEYNSAIKNNGITSFARIWIELEIIMLNELSQAQKTNIACSHAYVASIHNNNTIGDYLEGEDSGRGEWEWSS